jgi:Fur family zinc uptake transcriptional regulator
VLAICGECRTVEEHDGSGLLPKISAISALSSFRATRHIVEIHGTCQSCIH